MTRQDVDFVSGGVRCAGWFFPPTPESPFANGDGDVPVVVMAHGFCGTKDSGLEPYAEQLAEAGLAVFAFDYRGFGESRGEPRQRVSMAGQVEATTPRSPRRWPSPAWTRRPSCSGESRCPAGTC